MIQSAYHDVFSLDALCALSSGLLYINYSFSHFFPPSLVKFQSGLLILWDFSGPHSPSHDMCSYNAKFYLERFNPLGYCLLVCPSYYTVSSVSSWSHWHVPSIYLQADT